MSRLASSVRLTRSWFFAFAAILATVAQLAVAMAPLAESRERTMASHVESGSAKGHYAHDDAKCISCQARSIHGNAERPELPLIAVRLSATTIADGLVRAVSRDHNPQVNPRAPPALS